MNQDNFGIISIIVSTFNLLAFGLLFWQFKNLNKLKKIFYKSKNEFDLEAPFLNFSSELKLLSDEQAALHKHLNELKQWSSFAIQKIGVYRFNPFSENGGNFSFTLALLDANDNGVIITSMHGREQNRIYSKNIKRGNSDTQLTEEEEQALHLANEKFKTKMVESS